MKLPSLRRQSKIRGGPKRAACYRAHDCKGPQRIHHPHSFYIHLINLLPHSSIPRIPFW